MGRRAKKAPIQTKKRQTLAKRFKCPFCANEEVVECKMDFRAGIGSLACRLCSASYQMPIHHLHEPVDVFSEWLDDCEAAAQGKHGGGDAAAAAAAQVPRYEEDSDDDDDDDNQNNTDLPEPSGVSGSGKNAKSKKKATAAAANNKRVDSNNNDDDGGGGGAARPSYTDLGLDDSDDDSDDE